MVRGVGLRDVVNKTVVIAALGYFVDIYDLILFSVVRRASLTGLGLSGDALVDTGIMLLNWQMAGMLLGGIIWGVLGDKRGRVSVLFGSILLYSLANLANAFVTTIPAYAALRFLAGLGLAGELGAAITLVSEVMPKETRGYGAAVVAGLGITGGFAAVFVAQTFDWRIAYIVGGVGGLLLLGGRFTLRDSGMFDALSRTDARRGDFLSLFTNRARFGKYAASLLVGLPIWYVVGVLITFAPELAAAIGVSGAVAAPTAVLMCYGGLTLGDLGSGFLSGWIRSRKWVLIGFITATSGLVYAYLFLPGLTATTFYALCFLLGTAIGYWAVFNTNAAEQFGTDLRATVATTAPNFVRGMTIPVTLAFGWLTTQVGIVLSAMIVGQATILIALFAVTRLEETYGKELDYTEADVATAPSVDPLPAPVAA